MAKRIELLGDNWAFGIDFLIQCGLFERTGYGDWTIKSLGKGDRDNQTDGQYHHRYYAYRIMGRIGDLIADVELIKPFDLHGNIYSYQSIYLGTLRATGDLTNVSFSHHDCSDPRAVPSILEGEHF